MAGEGRVSVVVPNWNGARFLPVCLESLRHQTRPPAELVVVDNGSEDESLRVLEERFPEVRVIALGENLGFARAVNAGIGATGGGFVALLNNDAEADPSWLAELVACLERHPRAAAATSKMLLRADPGRFDGAGDIMTRYLRAYPRGRGEQDLGQYDEEVQVFSASGGASLWRATVLRELGLLDEDMFAYYEDVDLGFRARLAGYECWYAPRAVVLHEGGGSSGPRAGEFAHFHAVRNRWSVIVKDAPAALLLRCGLRVAFAELLSLARATRERQLGLMLRAYREVLHRLPSWRRRRRELQRQRRAGTSELLEAMEKGYPSFWHRVRRAPSR
jgi:GT2 family glycosyltransferase